MQDILMVDWQVHPKLAGTAHTEQGRARRPYASSDLIGACRGAVVPCEYFDTNGMDSKNGSPYKMPFVLGDSNACFNYVPPGSALPAAAARRTPASMPPVRLR